MQPPRPISIATYLAFLLAGLFFLLWGPNIGIRILLGDIGFVIWNMFLIVGGIVGIIGAAHKKFRVEIIAVPFLSSGLAVYGISLLPRLPDSNAPGVLAGLASVFIGSALGFLGQGFAIWFHKIRVAGDIERREEDGQ
jgi:hypothetical protein